MPFEKKNVDLIEVEDEHLSEHYVQVLEKFFKTRRVLFLVAPPGTGKTYGMGLLSLRIVSAISPIYDECRRLSSIHVAVPTHNTLSDFAKKIKSCYIDMFSRGAYVYRRPRLFILRGSIYSCPAREMLDRYRSIIFNLKKAGLDARNIAKLWLQFEMKGRRIARQLVPQLFEYALYSEVETTLSFLCRTCPRGRGNALFLKMVLEKGIDIIDTERDSAMKLVNELASEPNSQLDPETVCPYKAVLYLLLFEPQYRSLFTDPHIICTTHSLKLNLTITSFLEQRYAIVERGGGTVPHLDIIDEVDMPLLSPPKIRLPVYPVLKDMLTLGEVRQIIAKYIIPTKEESHIINKVFQWVTDLYKKIFTLCSRVRSGSLKAYGITYLILRYAEMMKQVDKRVVSRMRRLVEKLGKAISERLARGDSVDPLHLAVYFILEKTINFFLWLRKLDLASINTRFLAQMINVFAVDEDPRHWFMFELYQKLGLGKVRVVDLSISLYEHAIRAVMDVDYPYPIKGKIGMTATLSYDWLKSLIVGSYAPRNLKLKLTSRTICFIDVRTGYKNVKFYRSFSWTDIDTYKVFMDRSNIRRWAEYYPRLGHLIYFEARKDFLREEAEHGLRMGAHVFANQICEIHDIVKRGCNALIVYGTRNQMLTVADAIYRSVGRWIGAYYYMRWSKPKVDLDQGYANVEVEVEGHTYNVTLIYARGRWGRGVDLENYDVMMIASPALKIPDTVLRAVGKNPYMYPTTYIEASIATVQSCFRIIRRRFYPTPKYVFIDTSLLSSLVYDHYPSWFKRLIHLSDKTRIVKNIELANQIL